MIGPLPMARWRRASVEMHVYKEIARVSCETNKVDKWNASTDLYAANLVLHEVHQEPLRDLPAPLLHAL